MNALRYPTIPELAMLLSGIAIGVGFAIFSGLTGTQPSKAEANEAKSLNQAPTEADATDFEDEDFMDEEFEDEESDEILEQEEPHKLLFVIRNDLKMGKGKACAQIGHATLIAYRNALKKNRKALRIWGHHGQAKIVVKVESEADLYVPTILGMFVTSIYSRNAIKAAAEKEGILTSVVADAGRTQVAAGSRTVLALGPDVAKKIDKVAGHLSLY